MKDNGKPQAERHPFLIGLLAAALTGVWTLTAADAPAVKPLSTQSAKLFQAKLIEAKKKNPPQPPAAAKDEKPPEENTAAPDPDKPAQDAAAPTAISDADPTKAILRVGGDLGVAAELYGVPVILTDLFLLHSLTDAPAISTAKGEKISVTAMLVDKNGQLAILEPEKLPEGVKPLKISYEEIKQEDLSSNKPNPKRLISLYEIINKKVQPYDSLLDKITQKTLEFKATYKNSKWGAPVLNKRDELLGITYIFQKQTRHKVNRGSTENQAAAMGGNRCTASRVNNIDPAEFDLFDLEKMRREMVFYHKFRTLDDNCFRNINGPHYRWRIPRIVKDDTKKTVSLRDGKFPDKYDSFASFMYCYPLIIKENFTELMTYKPVMVFSQKDFDDLRYDFHTIAYHFPHMPLRGLSRGEMNRGAFFFRIIQRDRRPTGYVCTKCAGIGHNLGDKCDRCGGLGKAPTVPFYEFGNQSPISKLTPVTKPKFGDLSMGMELNTFLKMCKLRKAQFKNYGSDLSFSPGTSVPDYRNAFLNLNGIFDITILSGGWGAYKGKANSTHVVFMAQRLMFLAIDFPNDDYNYDALFQEMKAACGNPIRTWSDYTYFAHPNLDISISKHGSTVTLRAAHRVLRHTLFLVLGTLDQTLFETPGRTRVGEIGPFFP